MNAIRDQIQFMIVMDLKTETDLGIGLVRNEEYIGIYFNLTAWNIIRPSNVIQLSLRKGFLIKRTDLISSYRPCRGEINLKPFSSKRNENGDVQAGTHLIIVGNSTCQGTISKSDPAILNYYRQFLIKGFDSRYFEIFSLF